MIGQRLEDLFDIRGGSVPSENVLARRVNEAIGWSLDDMSVRNISLAGIACFLPIAGLSTVASVIFYESEFFGRASLAAASISWLLFSCSCCVLMNDISNRNRVSDLPPSIREFAFGNVQDSSDSSIRDNSEILPSSSLTLVNFGTGLRNSSGSLSL